jgi:ABC-type uncharacterized transport system substrate-binding protein
MGMKKAAVLSILLVVVLLVVAAIAEAQQPKKIPRVGYLVPGFPPAPAAPVASDEAFNRGLQELGYTVGKNVIVEYRYTEGGPARLPRLAAELVNSKVDVIVATSTPAIHAATQATREIPIVIFSAGDPVAARLVESLAHPGSNITGVTGIAPALSGKLLQLVTEAVAGVTRVGVLWSPAAKGSSLANTMDAAKALKVQLKTVEVRTSADFENAFSLLKKDRVGALVVLPAVFFARSEKRIADLAIKNRVPTIFWRSQFAEKGGLMAYGANISDARRRIGVLVGKILKGTKPPDLPVEQPTKFELVINIKTAKQIGLTIPPNVLARADRVIK